MKSFLVFSLLVTAAHAATRTSANYTISADTADLGGLRATSSTYTSDGSAGVVAGVSRTSSPGETDRNGYVGQLTEATALSVSSAASSIPQGASTQLLATVAFDDGTTAKLSGDDLAKSQVKYPFASIDSLGRLVASASVYVAPVGTAMVSYLGVSASVTMQVVGPYAGSGIPDEWMVQYFGPPPNAAAAPDSDADGTGQPNLLKYLAGLNPLDGSRFVLSIAAVPGQSGEKALTFSPVYDGRTYVLQFSPSLAPDSWQTLTTVSTNDSGNTRTVTDLNAAGGQRFYRVRISVP